MMTTSAGTIRTMGTILVVDDEPGIRRALRATLSALGFHAEEASSGQEGIDLARRHHYDAVLLDMNMPGKDGLETCRELRRASPTSGILILTVRDSEDDKVEALNAGADDYITKPFVMRELTARVRAVRRGRTIVRSQAGNMVIGDIALHSEARTVRKAGRFLHLTPREFQMLEYLMRHAGMPIRHQALLQAVWGPEYGNETEYLRTFVRQLRRKIEDDPASPQYLTTDAFIGYRFRAPAQ